MSSGTQLRVLTAAVLIPVVVAAIWWGPTWLVAGLAGIIAVFALLEFFAMAERIGFHAYRLWTCLAALGIFAQQWHAARLASNSRLGDLLYQARSPQVSLELVLFVFVLGAAGIAWGAAAHSLKCFLRFRSAQPVWSSWCFRSAQLCVCTAVDVVGPQLLLFTLVLVWVGDTAAYFVGRGFGRMKMSPQVSPNKTWEGAGANLLGALLVGALFGYWMKIEPVHMLAMAVLGSIAGQVGDRIRVGIQTQRRRKGFGNDPARAWRNARPD